MICVCACGSCALSVHVYRLDDLKQAYSSKNKQKQKGKKDSSAATIPQRIYICVCKCGVFD